MKQQEAHVSEIERVIPVLVYEDIAAGTAG